MNTSKNALQGTHTDSGQSAHLQASQPGENGGKSDSLMTLWNTPAGIESRRVLKAVLMEGVLLEQIPQHQADRLFARYSLHEL